VIKFLYAWRDHPDKTAEECEAHYRAVHMNLARQAYDGVEGFVALAYNRVKNHLENDYNQRELHERPTDMDAFVELWFEDRATLERSMNSPVLAQMFEDHNNFMDCTIPGNIRVYEVEEDVFFGRRRS
jgi:hypothetical protein